MLQIEMSASARNSIGKGAMRRLRAEGMTPAVVYGAGGEAMNLQLDTKSLMAQLLAFYRRNTLVMLKVDGGVEKSVIFGEVQTDPVRDTVVHVDFIEIDLSLEREFKVPVNYKGVAKGVDLGGLLQVQHPELVLLGKPVDIPDDCEVDITDLDIGDYVRCGKIKYPDTVELITDPRAVAVSIVQPGQKVEEEEEEEDETAEEVEAEEAPAE